MEMTRNNVDALEPVRQVQESEEGQAEQNGEIRGRVCVWGDGKCNEIEKAKGICSKQQNQNEKCKSCRLVGFRASWHYLVEVAIRTRNARRMKEEKNVCRLQQAIVISLRVIMAQYNSQSTMLTPLCAIRLRKVILARDILSTIGPWTLMNRIWAGQG